MLFPAPFTTKLLVRGKKSRNIHNQWAWQEGLRRWILKIKKQNVFGLENLENLNISLSKKTGCRLNTNTCPDYTTKGQGWCKVFSEPTAYTALMINPVRMSSSASGYLSFLPPLYVKLLGHLRNIKKKKKKSVIMMNMSLLCTLTFLIWGYSRPN